jgi:LPS export ABC transporter protein LptC
VRIPGPVVLVFLIGLAGLSWWLAQRDAGERASDESGVLAQPGYYLRDAHLEQTDATGRVTLSIVATSATEQPALADVLLEDIRVDYSPDLAHRWLMTAAFGTLPAAARSVLLSGDVRLSPAPGSQGSAARAGAVVRTEHLRVDVDHNLATTADPVRIDFQHHFVTAQGLHADLTRETLRLESAVNGTFAR